MKLLIIVAVGLIGVSSWAAQIIVGTSVEYSVKNAHKDGEGHGNMVLTVLQVDIPGSRYLVRGTATMEGSSSVQDSWMTEDEANAGAKIFPQCAAAGGTLEAITVPAGTFQTCHMTQTDPSQGYTGNFWVMDVAFNVVKSIEDQNGEVMTMELVKVK